MNFECFFESSRIKAFRFYLFLMNQKTDMDVFGSFGRKELGNDNHSQNVWDKLEFLWEIAHYRKSSISVFQKIFAGTDKFFFRK